MLRIVITLSYIDCASENGSILLDSFMLHGSVLKTDEKVEYYKTMVAFVLKSG